MPLRRDMLRGAPTDQILEIVQQHQIIGFPSLISLAREKGIKGRRLEEGLSVLEASGRIIFESDQFGQVIKLSETRIDYSRKDFAEKGE